MRSFSLFLAALPLLAAATACQVTTDGNNDSVAVSYDQETAENAAATASAVAQDVAAGAENLADKVGNDIEQEADRADEKLVTNSN